MKTQGELWNEGLNLLLNREYKKAEKCLLKALKTKDDTLQYRHLTYNALIRLYYKLRDKRKDALEKCIHYCKEDINILPDFLKQEKKEYGAVPTCTSVIQLAIIYEKKHEYQKAIDISNIAIKLGLEDDTKSGFLGRVERLKKKLKLKKGEKWQSRKKS